MRHSTKKLVERLLIWGIPSLLVWMGAGNLDMVPESIRLWLMENVEEFAGFVMILVYQLDHKAYEKFVNDAEKASGGSQ